MEKEMEHPITNVYITADTLISSLGFSTQENLEAISNYRSGVAMQPDGHMAATINPAGMQGSATHTPVDAPRLEQLFILAIGNILAQSGISRANLDCGLILSTTKGNIDLLAGQTDEPDERVFLGRMAKRIGAHFHTSHPVEVVSNACISGISALIVAKRWIETGIYKKVIVAGGDILSPFITSGFGSFKSLSPNRCLPYDARRDGLNLGEACGAMLLSSEGTQDDIILSGGAISNDANHISGPSRTGDGLYFAIRQAMNEAGVTPEEVSFINAHGTATVYNDEMESKAIHLAGLQAVPVNSLKPYFGHTLGASGVIESIICLHELKEGTMFGTLGYEDPGVPMPIVVSPTHLPLPMKCCIKTASGFGGCNAAIVLTKASSNPPHRGGARRAGEVLPTQNASANCTTVSIENSRLCVNDTPVLSSSAPDFASFIREAYKNLGESNMKFYKMDDLCKLGYVAAAYLLRGTHFAPEEIGIVLANAASSLDTDIRHQVIIDREGNGAASPAVFVYTLPNVVAGEICIRHKIQGENTFFVEEAYDPARLEQYARIAMTKGGLKACITGWCELLGQNYKAAFKLIEIQ